jgi:hypothetical protein
MTTTTLSGAARNAPAQSNSRPANGVVARHAVFNLANAPVANDQVELFWLPAGAQIVGAWLNAAALETGTAELALELGVEANNAGDAAALGLIFGPTTFTDGAALQIGPEKVASAAYTHTFNDRTKVVLTFTHAATTYAAGNVDVVVQYVTPGAPTSH